jgi:hypothetical protein
VLILGGKHGDMPIEPTGGAVVADLVADESISVIIDISRKPDGKMWSRGDRIKFVADYCTRLYERQGERRRPLLQIIDEAGRYVPQEIRKDQPEIARCMGAVESLVEEARNVGVGVMLITQRSARMNKSVSELADAMFAFRTVGPRSVEAILDWFGEHVPKDRWKDLIDQLRKLPRGTALVVSPGWLEFEGQAAIRMRRTFDSSATPKAGKEQRASGPGAKPDLARYQERMAETIERVASENPQQLRKRIAELEKALRAKSAASPAPAKSGVAKKEALEKAAARGAAQVRREVAKEFGALVGPIRKAMLQSVVSLRESAAELERVLPPTNLSLSTAVDLPAEPDTPAARPAPPRIERPARQAPAPRQQAATAGEAEITRPQQAILDGLAWLEVIGIDQTQRNIVGFLAGASPKSSSFVNNLGALRTAGLIDYPVQGLVALSDAGRDQANRPAAPPTSEHLHQMVYGRLPRPQAAILEVLIAAYPESLSRDAVADQAGASPTSSSFVNNLGALRSIGLIDYPAQGHVEALPLLFLDRRSASVRR